MEGVALESTYKTTFKKALAFKQPRKLVVSQIALLIALLFSDGPQSGCSVAAGSAGTTSLQLPQIMNALMLSGTFQVVGAGPGDQINPHVDCNLASYTSDSGLTQQSAATLWLLKTAVSPPIQTKVRSWSTI